MDTVDLLRRLHQHRQSVSRQLLAACQTLSGEQLRQPREIGQGSIWRSLTHMYAAEYVWLEALEGNVDPLTPGDARGQLPGNQQGEGAMSSLAELEQRWKELDERWGHYLLALDVDTLEDTVEKLNSRSGQRSGARRSDVLLHVATHAHYTAAQTINMLRHAGVETLPDAMLISLARGE